MNRDQLAAHMDQRFSHVLQCAQRAADADRELARVQEWHVNAASSQSGVALEKASNAATAAYQTLEGAKTEFLFGLYDVVEQVVNARLNDTRRSRRHA